MTANELYLNIRKRLKEADIAAYELEAKELCAFACGLEKRHYLEWGYIFIAQETERKAWELVRERLMGKPIAYIIGEWDFYGYTFQITPDVLVPRSDTESLCRLAVERAKDILNPRVLDVCTGSGCIGIAIAREVEDAKVTGVDVSEAALAVARENARRNRVESRFIALQDNALGPYNERLGQFHILVSNPPYISKEEMVTLDTDVIKYEPHLALYGGEDGLDFYRSIAGNWKDALLYSGMLLLECGYRQATQVAAILEENAYHNIQILEDLSGVPRIVTGMSL